MIRLPNPSSKDLIKALQNAGFVVDRQKGSHVVMYHPGRKARTVVPLHNGDVSRNLLKKIIKQAGLTEDDLRELL